MQGEHMSAGNTVAHVRRVPRQDRSELRFELILDTTAALINEVGYGSITPSLIAKRVGMSGPGIYRYFDGMQSIARALAKRNLARLVQNAAVLVQDESLEWQDAMAGAVELYASLFRTEPGFRWLRLGDAVDRNLIDEAESNRTIVARLTAEMFVKRYEVSHRDDLLQHVEVMVEIADSLISRAFLVDPDGDPFFIAECARVITEYLAEYLERTLPEAERLGRRAEL
jgi:AcrR family transcriptional regulator